MKKIKNVTILLTSLLLSTSFLSCKITSYNAPAPEYKATYSFTESPVLLLNYTGTEGPSSANVKYYKFFLCHFCYKTKAFTEAQFTASKKIFPLFSKYKNQRFSERICTKKFAISNKFTIFATLIHKSIYKYAIFITFVIVASVKISTLRNSVVGTILKPKYYVKKVNLFFSQNSGCKTQKGGGG